MLGFLVAVIQDVGTTAAESFLTINALLAGVNIVVIIGAAYHIGGKLATIVTKLEFLLLLPAKVELLEKEVNTMKGDLSALWSAFREEKEEAHADRTTREEKDQQRIERIFARWDRTRKP